MLSNAANHKKTVESCDRSMKDLQDRGKFVRVAAAAAKVDTSSGPLPDIFYQEMSWKVQKTSHALLSQEAEAFERKCKAELTKSSSVPTIKKALLVRNSNTRYRGGFR
mmetsp:Transcript_42749/g.92258  ORF Transcript_42749/g.92258 Transcript_42749/m.92258 type:complete len:108 (+) Transcript_42749:313-636(+)